MVGKVRRRISKGDSAIGLRLRRCASAALTTAVGLSVGVVAVGTAAPASAATVDKNISYTCVITDADANGDGSIDVPYLPITQPVVARTRVTIPDTVAKGETIPETPVLIDIDLSSVADTMRITFGTHVKSGSSNTQVHFGINGTDQAVTLQSLQAPWMAIPNNNATGMEAAGTWIVPLAGTVPAVTIPESATGSITIDGPASFTIDSFHNDTGVDPHGGTSNLECTVINVDELRLGTIQGPEVPSAVATVLAGTVVASTVDKDVSVELAVTPATATGTISLSHLGNPVGMATLANGGARIVVPAATLPDPGTYVLQAHYSGDATHLPSSSNLGVVRTAPPSLTNSVLPSVSGTPMVGETLTAEPGTWSPSAQAVGYQWLADGDEIAGATERQLELGTVHLGKRLAVRVTAFRADHVSGTATSDATPTIMAPIANLARPTISDTTPTIGQVLTAGAGTWNPDDVSLAYRWLADDVVIEGARSAVLTVSDELEGARLSVRVIASKQGYVDGVAESARTATVVADDESDPVLTNTVLPSISGTPEVGGTLSAAPGTWTPGGASYTYQWLVDGSVVTGDTGTSYVVRAADVGKKVSVRVTASAPKMVSGVATSAPTAAVTQPVAPTPTPTPTPVLGVTPDLSVALAAAVEKAAVKGRAKVGRTVKLVNLPSAVGGQSVVVKVTWYAGKKAIKKATKTKLKVTKALKGKPLSVKVTLVVGGVTKTVRLKVGKVK